ncbi:MAG: hypothetical protein ACPLX8_00930, partial [Nanopusillaceae archaeon]
MSNNKNLYRIISYRKFQFNEKTDVRLLLENIDLKTLLSNNYKKYFGGTWNFVYYPQIKVINKMFRNSQSEFRFVSQNRFNLVKFSKAITNLKQVIMDVTPQVNYITNKFNVSSTMFDQVFSFISPNSDRKTILLYVISDENPMTSYSFSMMYKILRRIYIKQKDLDKYSLPDEFIVNLKIKGRNYFATLVLDKDWSNIKTVINYFKLLYNKLGSPSKELEKTNLAIAIVNNDSDEELDNSTEDTEILEKSKEIKIKNTSYILNKTNVVLDKNLPEKEKVFIVQKNITKKIVPKSNQNDIDYSKVVKRTIDNVIVPEKIPVNSPLPISQK